MCLARIPVSGTKMTLKQRSIHDGVCQRVLRTLWRQRNDVDGLRVDRLEFRETFLAFALLVIRTFGSTGHLPTGVDFWKELPVDFVDDKHDVQALRDSMVIWFAALFLSADAEGVELRGLRINSETLDEFSALHNVTLVGCEITLGDHCIHDNTFESCVLHEFFPEEMMGSSFLDCEFTDARLGMVEDTCFRGCKFGRLQVVCEDTGGQFLGVKMDSMSARSFLEALNISIEHGELVGVMNKLNVSLDTMV
jgi:hypothetical protein